MKQDFIKTKKNTITKTQESFHWFIYQKNNKMVPESTKLNISSRKIDITVTPDRFQALPRLQKALKAQKMTQNRPICY